MKCEMIPHFIFFAAAFATVTGTPCIQMTEENACCPPVKIDWSSSTPDLAIGQDVTMFCAVNIGNAALANSTEVEWPVQPHRSLQKDVLVSDDGKTIKAILSLKNVTKDDEGPYTITFRNMCGSESCISSINIRNACSYERPYPVQKEDTIKASPDASTLKIAANFSGSIDQTRWHVIWSNSSYSGLGFLGGKYHTRRQVVSDCFFTEELIIRNVSKNDAGWYFAKVYDSRDTGVNTTFYVNVMDRGREKKNKYLALVSVCAVLLLALGGVIGVTIYLRLRSMKKRKLSGLSSTHTNGSIHTINLLISSEAEEVDWAFPTTNPQLAPQYCPHGHGHDRVFFLYCKVSVSEESLYNMADILATYGISSCLDITTNTIPANWNSWTEERIESCDYVILVCTKPLYKALKGTINCTDDYLVDMFKGKYFSCAVVNCIQAPKFIPVFINCNPDKNVVPTQLRTHHFFHLRIGELMQAVEGKPVDNVHKEINDNQLFKDIKQLIELLQ